MAFRVSEHTRTGIARAWDVLTDWPAHERWVPFTRILLADPQAGDPTPAGPPGFVATTRFGPLRLVDRMEITAWSPPGDGAPGRCEIRKIGPHLRGGAVIEVRPDPSGGARLNWYEDAEPASPLLAELVRPFDVLVRPLVRAMFRRALRRAVREMEQGGD